MALLEVNYYSNTLGMERNMIVMLPEKTKRTKDFAPENLKDIPVIYLLHGMSDSAATWLKRSNIERYLRKSNVALVIPNADLSFYANTNFGLNYLDALAIELPQKIQELFPQISTKREKNFVVGISMGGYGAWKLALYSNQFSYAVSLSGALLDYSNEKLIATQLNAENMNFWTGIFGDIEHISGSDNDLIALLNKKRGTGEPLPKFYSKCGTEDDLYLAHKGMGSVFKKLGADVTMEEAPGTHEWKYWDAWLRDVFEFLPFDYIDVED
jgi:putative tributyrin esterase